MLSSARPSLGKSLQWSSWIALALMIALWPRGRPKSGTLTEALARRLQPGRGRTASAPWRIPARGWADILWRTWREFRKDGLQSQAAAITYYLLLALFPALAAFVSLYGLFADVHDAFIQISALAVFAPHAAVKFVGDQMIRIAAERGSTLSLTFVISLVFSIWSANSGMKSLLNGLNIAYDETEKRGFVRLNLHSLGFTVAGLVFLVMAVAAMVVAPVLMPFLAAAAPVLTWLRWPAFLAVTILGLQVVYRYGPSREHARWRWVSVGGAVAAVLWMAASGAYSWYMANLAHYDRTYGSFGAAVGGMIWLWFSVLIVLLGAELNSEIEHQTAVDSTTGKPVPMGLRGAAMADSIGEARKR